MNCELEVRFNHRLTRQSHISSADRYTLSQNPSHVAEGSSTNRVGAFAALELSIWGPQHSAALQLPVKYGIREPKWFEIISAVLSRIFVRDFVVGWVLTEVSAEGKVQQTTKYSS